MRIWEDPYLVSSAKTDSFVLSLSLDGRCYRVVVGYSMLDVFRFDFQHFYFPGVLVVPGKGIIYQTWAI